MEKPSNRYDGIEHSLPEHTFAENCPACQLINQKMTPQQNEELVEVLMKQFDDMVDRGAVRLKDFAKDKITLLNGLLKDDKKS